MQEVTERVVAEIDKNKNEKIRVSLSNFKGHELINLRIWYKSKGEEYFPSAKGIALSVEFYKPLMDALGAVGAVLSREGEI